MGMVSARPEECAQEELSHQELALGIGGTSRALGSSHPHFWGALQLPFKNSHEMWYIDGGAGNTSQSPGKLLSTTTLIHS